MAQRWQSCFSPAAPSSTLSIPKILISMLMRLINGADQRKVDRVLIMLIKSMNYQLASIAKKIGALILQHWPPDVSSNALPLNESIIPAISFPFPHSDNCQRENYLATFSFEHCLGDFERLNCNFYTQVLCLLYWGYLSKTFYYKTF